MLKIVLGALTLLLGVKQFRGRPRGDARPDLPKWMRAVDTFTPARSIAIAASLSGVNPKDLLITVGAAAAIAQTGVGAGRQAIAMARNNATIMAVVLLVIGAKLLGDGISGL